MSLLDIKRSLMGDENIIRIEKDVFHTVIVEVKKRGLLPLAIKRHHRLVDQVGVVVQNPHTGEESWTTDGRVLRACHPLWRELPHTPINQLTSEPTESFAQREMQSGASPPTTEASASVPHDPDSVD